MTPQDLISLAEKIIDPALGVDDVVELLGEYTTGLDKWLSGSQAGDPEDLQLLAKRHDEVVKKALSLKDDASLELRKVKAKGKGILAYVDILPKRISFGTKKKG